MNAPVSQVVCDNSKPDRLWSLWDMINYSLTPLLNALDLLRGHKANAYMRMMQGRGNEIVQDPILFSVVNNVEAAGKVVADMMLSSADNRISRLYIMFGRNFTFQDLEGELRVLIESIEDDCKFQRFYHYPNSRVHVLLRTPGDWASTIQAFPSAASDITEAMDLYALDHPTAAVFHLMRVAECGLRSLAHERGVKFANKPLEWANWQDLITKVRQSAKAQWDGAAAGPSKDAAQDFYAGALSQFEGFKDKYRNAVSHVRKQYDELEALSAINHVRDFMNGLSRKIGEKTRRPITRWV